MLLIVGCMLVLRFPPRQLTPFGDRFTNSVALYKGKPMGDLLAQGLPEQAWFTDDACRPMVTKFALDNVMDTVFLASHPRSGNSWTRYLIEAATGVFTNAFGPFSPEYRAGDDTAQWHKSREEIWSLPARGMAAFGYLGEELRWTQGNTIVAKTHHLPVPWPNKVLENKMELSSKPMAPFAPNTTRRAILIVRDPFRVILSTQLYTATKSMHSEDIEVNTTALYSGPGWEQEVMFRARLWLDFNEAWLKRTNQTYVLFYEKLVRQPMRELQGVLEFLGVVADQGRMWCLRRQLEGPAHNRKRPASPSNFTFPARLRAEVWSRIHQLQWTMKELGYPPLPLDLYSFADVFMNVGS